jgi:hypothetical protein
MPAKLLTKEYRYLSEFDDETISFLASVLSYNNITGSGLTYKLMVCLEYLNRLFNHNVYDNDTGDNILKTFHERYGVTMETFVILGLDDDINKVLNRGNLFSSVYKG